MPRAFSALNSLLREHSSAARHAQSVSGDVHERHGFDPDQPRIPADSSHGGEWTASDGSVSDARVLSDALPANDWLPGAQYASARGRGAGLGRMEPGQATRLAVAQDRARKAMDRVRQIDPDWKPQFSVSQTNEGLIRSFEARAQEAEARPRCAIPDRHRTRSIRDRVGACPRPGKEFHRLGEKRNQSNF